MSAKETTTAIDQVFSAYLAYSTAPEEASLLKLLDCLQGLDQVLAVQANRLTFLRFPEYRALKALLDHAKYVGDARNVVRLRSLLDMPVTSDISQACLVSRADCHAALLSVAAASRLQAKRAVFSTFRQWGPVVDINPSIFTCMAKVFEVLRVHGLKGEGTAFQAFEESYDYQADNGLPHYVTGAVPTREADEQKVMGMMTNLYLS